MSQLLRDLPMKLARDLDGLVWLLVPQLFKMTEAQREAHARRLLQLCMRLMEMEANPADQANVNERTRYRFVQAGRAADALEYSALLNRLGIAQPGLVYPDAALQLLTSLMLSPSPSALPPDGEGAALLTRPAGLPSPPPKSIKILPTPAIEPNLPPERAAQGGEGRARGRDADEPSNRREPAHRRGKPAERAFKHSADEVSERDLVRDLLYVMQNIDGNYLKWDEARDAFVLPKGVRVPPGARQLAGRIAELGWLFRAIQTYTRATVQAYTSAAKPGDVTGPGGIVTGLVPQALSHALQAELDEWFQVLAVLEQQRQHQLTLVQLTVWSSEPMQRLVVMAKLVRSASRLTGGALTVALQRHEKHGDPAISEYVCHLLRACCAPLYSMLTRWVLDGELAESHQSEFFIQQTAAPLADLWSSR